MYMPRACADPEEPPAALCLGLEKSSLQAAGVWRTTMPALLATQYIVATSRCDTKMGELLANSALGP